MAGVPRLNVPCMPVRTSTDNWVVSHVKPPPHEICSFQGACPQASGPWWPVISNPVVSTTVVVFSPQLPIPHSSLPQPDSDWAYAKVPKEAVVKKPVGKTVVPAPPQSSSPHASPPHPCSGKDKTSSNVAVIEKPVGKTVVTSWFPQSPWPQVVVPPPQVSAIRTYLLTTLFLWSRWMNR